MRKPKLSKLERLEKFDMFVSLSKQRSVQILMAVGLLYMLLITFEIPFVFKTGLSSLSQDPLTRPEKHNSQRELQERRAPSRPFKSLLYQESQSEPPAQGLRRSTRILSSLRFDPETFNPSSKDGSVELHKSAKVAWEVGRKIWEELESGKTLKALEKEKKKKIEEHGSNSCSLSVSLTGSDLSKRGNLMELPCGLTLGSHITVVGKPRAAHSEKDPKISMLKEGDEAVKVSQFKLELQGLKAVEGEEPPRILHLNPRLKGDWSGKPVIEQNTCYRMQWGSAQRCEGWRSRDDEETG